MFNWKNKVLGSSKPSTLNKEISPLADQSVTSLEAPLITSEISHEVSDKSPKLETSLNSLDNTQLLRTFRDIRQWLDLGETITPEDVERLSGQSWEDLNNLLTQHSVDIQAQGSELLEVIQTVMEMTEKNEVLANQVLSEKTSDSSLAENIRRLWQKPATKYVFATLMLLAKFVPEAKATDKSSDLPVKPNTEVSAAAVGTDDNSTYQLEPADLESSPVASDVELDHDNDNDNLDAADKQLPSDPEAKWLEFSRYAKLELSNYYSTDLADISPEHQQQISEQFSDFLSQINSDNFSQIIAHDWEISGSSDERPTKNWQGRNESLTKARIATAQEILQQTLQNYDFSQSSLSDEQITTLKTKLFTEKVFVSDSGSEPGVKYITDLINPQTGDFYTPAEVDALSEADRDNLLQQCRQISFDGLVPKLETLNKMPALDVKLNMDNPLELEKILTNWNNYHNVTLLVDNSPSMGITYQYMAEVIAQQSELKNTSLQFGTFSDRLDKLTSMNNASEATSFVREMTKDGHHQERALHSALEALKQLPEVETNEKNLILVATDEPLQAITQDLLDQLVAEAEKKNCQLTFIYAHTHGEKVARAIPLEEVAAEYSKILWERLAPRAESALSLEESRLERLESGLNNMTKIASNLLERDLSRNDRQRLKSLQARIDDFEQQINYSQLLKNQLSDALTNNDPRALLEASKSTRSINVEQINRLTLRPDQLGVDIKLD